MYDCLFFSKLNLPALLACFCRVRAQSPEHLVALLWTHSLEGCTTGGVLVAPELPRPFLQSRVTQPVSPQPVLVRGLTPSQEQDFVFVHVEFLEISVRPL